MDSESDKLTLRSFFLNNLKKPVILKGYLLQPTVKEKWKSINWSRKDWLNLLRNEHYPVQFGKKIDSKFSQEEDFPQWEYLNLKGKMTYEEMLEWEENESSFTTSNKTKVTHKEYWAYLDYYYMKNLKNLKLADDIISWETLGFPELNAKDATIWIGTNGANTPCHLDTYGANIVCQILGKKRWTLFPKDQSQLLYPTRIPYEESSIYSEIDFPNPNIVKFPKLKSTSPYHTTLKAGDVLLVPKHWWHFVENLDFSISINTWVPLSTDLNDRIKEALILFQIGSLCQSLTCPSVLRSIFHANMMDTLLMNSSELFQLLKSKVLDYKTEQDSAVDHSPNNAKRLKLDTDVHDGTVPQVWLKTTKIDIQCLKSCSYEEYCSLVGIDYLKTKTNHLEYNSPSCSLVNSNSEANIAKVLIQSFTDERVIQTLKNALDENLSKL